MLKYKDKPIIAFVVPTGIGASIGGFAGDASLTAQKFAREFNVIVNPNVVNAACFSGITSSMLYTEGWALNELFKGNITLKPAQNNKIGIIFDKGISKGILNVHINTINAVKTIYGSNILGYEITDEPCGIEFFKTASGVSSGSIRNNGTLLRAGEKLLRKGCDAIAVVCRFEEPPEDNYKYGNDVDIAGGIEAVISHYLSRELKVPVVHAPAFEDISITKEVVDPRASSEYITPTFLPCLLIALMNAPLISFEKVEYNISTDDIKALVMPYGALGSSIVFDAISHGIKVCAVKENKSVLNITKDIIKCAEIISTDTYDDCIKILRKLLYE